MSGLVIGLVIGCAVAVLLVFCFIRSICKDKKALSRQTKQVQIEEDGQTSAPPSEEGLRQHQQRQGDIEAQHRSTAASGV